MSVLDTMKAASAARRQVTLCLDGALQAEHDELQKAFVQASIADQREGRGDNPSPATLAAADAMDEVIPRMRASEVAFTFERLPWARRLELQASHPPRDNNLRDRVEGANEVTYMPALIRESCVSVKGADGVEVTDIPDDVWDAMVAGLQLDQMQELFTAAKSANDMAPTVPFSARALLTRQDLGASSKQPEPGMSPRNGSKGGNPRSRRKSSTAKKAASSVT
jgi:hypothetical protein